MFWSMISGATSPEASPPSGKTASERALALLVQARRATLPKQRSEALRRLLGMLEADPRFMAMGAATAERADDLRLAEDFALKAIERAPGHRGMRLLTARASLARYDGDAAIDALKPLEPQDAEALPLLLEAALLAGNDDVLRAVHAAPTNAAADDARAAIESAREAVRKVLALPAPGGSPRDGEPAVSDLHGVLTESVRSLDAALTQTLSQRVLEALVLRARLRLGQDPRALLSRAARLTQEAPVPGVWLALGEVGLAAGDHAAVSVALHELSKASAAEPSARCFAARVLAEAQRFEEARNELEPVIAQHPLLVEARLILAEVLLELGELDRAAALAQTLVVELDPDVKRSSYRRAALTLTRSELERNQPEAARAALARIREGTEPEHWQLAYLSRVSLSEGRPDEALAWLERATQREPTLLALRARAELAQGRRRAAEEALLAARELDPASVEVLAALAELRVAQGRARAALGLAARTISLLGMRRARGEIRARMLLVQGRALLDLGGHAQASLAEGLLRSAIELPSHAAETHFFLALARNGLHVPGQRAALLTYLEREPEGGFARRARSLLRRMPEKY
jgi:tetratricopeptide (TPR) repeat protein